MAPDPYYADDLVTLYHGRAEDITAWHGADVLVCDPPYGFGAYATDVRASAGLLRDAIERHRATAVFGYPETLAQWCVEMLAVPDEWITWWPTNSKGRPVGPALGRESEHVAVFGPTYGDRIRRPRTPSHWARKVSVNRGLDPETCRAGDVWMDPSPNVGSNGPGRLHKNQKPLSLMERLITLVRHEGDVVADPYAGSGTTLLAARNLGHRSVGVEIDERHCETIVRRLAEDVLPLASV